MPVKLTDVHSLPICPSSNALRTLPPSQKATVLSHTSSTLFYALSLSDEQLSRLSCSDFIATYSKGEASKILNALVFPADTSDDTERRPPEERDIRRRVLSLALRLAGLPKAGGISLSIILDICVVYGPQNSTRVKELFQKAIQSNPAFLQDVQSVIAPSFASILLSSESGLHALRKTTHCLKSLLQSSPPSLLDEFAKNTEFVLALAKCYDARLSAIAAGYGGIRIDRIDEAETSTLWVGCKVALIDAFHVLLQHVLNGVRTDPRAHVEHAFDLVFALLNLPQSPSARTAPTPFLNRPLLADYQDAYGLSATLASVLSNNGDPRLDVLEATLKSFESEVSSASAGDKAGALKIILRSSGVAPGIDNRRIGGGRKGKDRAVAPEPGSDHLLPDAGDLDMAVSSVLEVLPDQDPGYVRRLLALQQYEGNAESVIAALLEGDAPLLLEPELEARTAWDPVPERRNIFDEQHIEPTNVHIGKRGGNADDVLQDRAFLDQMKADILRRAEELSDSDHDEDEAVDDDDIDALLESGVKVVADGEGSEESEDDNEEDNGGTASGSRSRTPAPQPQTPETICELAYIKDPKVFDRDAETRRSKDRADLKARTGWADEQLEGWRIMLEKNVREAFLFYYYFQCFSCRAD